MTPDHFAELLLIDQSRAQREALASMERNSGMKITNKQIADIRHMTARNDHGGAVASVVEISGNANAVTMAKLANQKHESAGHLTAEARGLRHEALTMALATIRAAVDASTYDRVYQSL